MIISNIHPDLIKYSESYLMKKYNLMIRSTNCTFIIYRILL